MMRSLLLIPPDRVRTLWPLRSKSSAKRRSSAARRRISSRLSPKRSPWIRRFSAKVSSRSRFMVWGTRPAIFLAATGSLKTSTP